ASEAGTDSPRWASARGIRKASTPAFAIAWRRAARRGATVFLSAFSSKLWNLAGGKLWAVMVYPWAGLRSGHGCREVWGIVNRQLRLTLVSERRRAKMERDKNFLSRAFDALIAGRERQA